MISCWLMAGLMRLQNLENWSLDSLPCLWSSISLKASTMGPRALSCSSRFQRSRICAFRHHILLNDMNFPYLQGRRGDLEVWNCLVCISKRSQAYVWDAKHDRQTGRQAGSQRHIGRQGGPQGKTCVTTWKDTVGPSEAASLLGLLGELPSLRGDGDRVLLGDRARPSAESYTTAAARTR